MIEAEKITQNKDELFVMYFVFTDAIRLIYSKKPQKPHHRTTRIHQVCTLHLCRASVHYGYTRLRECNMI